MYVVCFAAYSGQGKTTLVEKLVASLRLRGLRVSVLKHAHHHFDIDQPGKDSWRHRQAGAQEVLIASDQRLALMREFSQPDGLSVHQLLAEFRVAVDWVFVEGFKDSNLPKIEIWRAPEIGKQAAPARFTYDAHVIAVATNTPDQLPATPTQPVLDLDNAESVLDWLLLNQDRCMYTRNA